MVQEYRWCNQWKGLSMLSFPEYIGLKNYCLKCSKTIKNKILFFNYKWRFSVIQWEEIVQKQIEFWNLCFTARSFACETIHDPKSPSSRKVEWWSVMVSHAPYRIVLFVIQFILFPLSGFNLANRLLQHSRIVWTHIAYVCVLHTEYIPINCLFSLSAHIILCYI